MPAPLRIPDLPRALEKLLAQVPAGRVTTYGWLAEALGAVVAARWVATHLLHSPSASNLASQRVVLRDGRLGQFWTRRPGDKARALRREGVRVIHDQTNLERYGFREFVTRRPLASLLHAQQRLVDRLCLQPPADMPRTVAGLDVSYASPNEAVAACTLVEASTGVLLWSTVLRKRVTFPYIPSFLTFRELPLLLELLREAEQQGQRPDVVLVDGTGILHPRHAGIATHLGILSDLPTIGVSKKRLCGVVDLQGMQPGETRPVVHKSETLAVALQTVWRGKPIYVSPGNQVDVPYAAEVVKQLLHGHHLPEPTHWAHALSRKAVEER